MSPSSDPPCSRVTAAFWSPLKLVPLGTTVTWTEPFEVFLTWSAKCWAVTPTEEVSGSGMESWILATGALWPAGVPPAQPDSRAAARLVASTPVMARVLRFIRCLSSLEGCGGTGSGDGDGGGNQRFGFAAEFQRLGQGVINDDIVPTNDRSLGHVVTQFHVVGQRDGQGAGGNGVLGGNQLAPDREAPFAVEEVAGLEVFLGGGDDVAVETNRPTGGDAAKGCVGDGHVQFESNVVVRPVQCGVLA